MKKLLSFVGALTITASSVTVVAFEYANLVKSSIEAKIRNYINISSLLARGAILSQKSKDDHGQTTDGQDFSLEYASKYLYGKEITDFFNDSSFQNVEGQSVRSFLGSMFNLSSSQSAVYTVKSNTDFQTNLALQADVGAGVKGEEPIMSTISLLTAALSILFGSDFSAASSASFLESLLSAGESAILGMFADGGGTVKSMQEFLFDKDHNQSLFNKISTALSEEDLNALTSDSHPIESLTFQEVFNFRQVEFWQGLAEILYSGNHANDDTATWDQWMDDIKNADKKEYAKVAVPTDVDISVVANKILIDGICKVLRYVRTLFVYIQSFSVSPLEIAPFISVDDNHLFSLNKSNGMFLADKLNTETYINSTYVLNQDNSTNPEIIQWYKIGNTYHQVLNFQDIFSFFANLLSPDPINDPHGYRVERNLAILFGLPLQSDAKETDSKDPNAKNPVFDLVLEPLLTQLVTKLANNNSLIGMIIGLAAPLLRATLTYNNPLWENVAGSSISNVLAALGIVKGLLGLVDLSESLKTALTKFLTDLENQIIDERDASTPAEPPVYGQPFTSIFNGKFLIKIFCLLNETKEPTLNISQAIQDSCKNLVTILNTKLGDLLSGFGLNISTLPLILYGIKDLSVAAIIDTFAAEFETNREKTLKDNQTYIFNLGVLNRITVALDQKVQITFKGSIPDDVDKAGILENGQANILNAIFITFAYSNEIAELEIIGTSESWNSNQFGTLKPYTFLLGNRHNDDNTYSFGSGSIFNTLAQIYGHYNPDQVKDPEQIQEPGEASFKEIVTGAGKLVNWVNKVSIPSYVTDHFDPYFAAQNWTTKLIETSNLNDSSQMAILKYVLDYQQPGSKEKHHYEVTLNRAAKDGSDDNWNNFKPWRIASINRIN